ncbi:hypothetical protein CLOM_g23122 [Closterium sp. NIES-68]|nr:hypothetical protein CLOM_g23122 [Closterium sp. NIES-68]GJP77632.1 hypothetical protein CLOP_g7991 [Closterium sp. NIES-67]
MDFAPAFATGPPSSLHKPSVAGRIGNWRGRADEGFLMLPIPEEGELVEMSAEAGSARAAWRAQALLGIILGEKDSASFKEAETKGGGGGSPAGGAGMEWGAGEKDEAAEAEVAAEAAATAALRQAMSGITKHGRTHVLGDSAGYSDAGKSGASASGAAAAAGGGNSGMSRWRSIAAAMLGKRAPDPPPAFEMPQGATKGGGGGGGRGADGGAWWAAWLGDSGRCAEHGRNGGGMAEHSQADLNQAAAAAAAAAAVNGGVTSAEHHSMFAKKHQELELANPPSPLSVSPPSSGASSPPTSASSSSSSSASSPESSASAQEGTPPEPCYLHEDAHAGGSMADGDGGRAESGEAEGVGHRQGEEAPVIGSFMGFAMRGAQGGIAAGADGASRGGSGRGQAWGWLEGGEAEGQVQADVRAIENQQHALRHALERAQNRRGGNGNGSGSGSGRAQLGADGGTGGAGSANGAEAEGPAGLPANLMGAWREAWVESGEDRLGGAQMARRKEVDAYGYGYGCSAYPAETTPGDGRISIRNPRRVAVKPGGKSSLWLGVKSWAASRTAARRRRVAAVPRAQREGEWAVWGIGFAVFALINVQLITGCALLWLCLPAAWSATARAAVAGCASALVGAQLAGNVLVAAFARAAVLREFLRRKMKAAGKAQGVAVGGQRGAGRAEDGEAADVEGKGEAVAACGVACALDVEQLLAEQGEGEGGSQAGERGMMKGFHSRPLLVYKAEHSIQSQSTHLHPSEPTGTAPTDPRPYSPAPSPTATAAAAAAASAAASSAASAAAAAAAAAPMRIRNGSSSSSSGGGSGGGGGGGGGANGMQHEGAERRGAAVEQEEGEEEGGGVLQWWRWILW